MKKDAKKDGRATGAGGGLLSGWKAFLPALALALGMIALGGLLPKREDSLYEILWVCGCVALILCYLGTWIYLHRLNRVYGGDRLADTHKVLERKQQSVEADLSAAAARIRSDIRFARLWYALTLLPVLMNLALTVPAGLPVPVSLLGVWILWGLLSIWFDRQKQKAPETELSAQDYPVICGVVKQAAEASGCSLPVRIFAGGETVSICRQGGEIWILLDAVTCALFTKSELYHALLHEFSHETNEDTLLTYRISRETALWGSVPEGVLPGIGGYLLNLPAAKLAMDSAFYRMFASRRIEAQADADAVARGSAQELVNGLAKLSVWSIFETDTPAPELSLYTQYAGEKPLTDIPARALRAYREMLPRMREQWRRRLDVELPPRVSSHPIFRQRREAFGITDYSFEAVETDEGYLAETEAMLAMTGEAVAKQMEDDYEKERQYQYFERKELIDKAKAVTDWSVPSFDERIEMAKALAVLEPELQETVIQSILAQEPENAYGCLLLGRKRFLENDPACVELLKKAAEGNFNFVEQAYDMIGDYALASGRQDLLDAYRAEVAEAVQESRDTIDSLQLRWHGKEEISPNDLPPERFNANLDAILSRTEGKLAHLYSVRQQTGREPCYHYFLEFPAELDKAERGRLYHQVFLYLDYLPDDEPYALEDLTDEPKKRAYLLRRVPGCEIPLDRPES